MRKICLLFSMACVIFPSITLAQEECTVAVVSGKATIDGRPLLWKNRDTSFLNNEVAFFDDSRIPFIGVINAGDRSQVWMGVNAAGFAIMNSESQDLEGDTLDAEGYFMKQALGECASVAAFEQLLLRTNQTDRNTKANFGVIDSTGAAMIYETGNTTFTKFDANDSATTPLGFIARANFAKTGTGKGYGHIRYQRANELFEKLIAENRLSHETLLTGIARDLKNDKTDPYPLPFAGSEDGHPKGCIKTHDSINRFRTASCAVFHGVLPGESAALTTLWLILGEPVCGVAIPLWAAAGTVPPALDGEDTALLNEAIQRNERIVYPDTSMKNYLNTTMLMADDWKNALPALIAFEEDVFQKTQAMVKRWRKRAPKPTEVFGYEQRVATEVMQRLSNPGPSQNSHGMK
ncbi:MAG: hypothetical protein ACOY90_04765 [Candidatus Zhuqueibacterota bacterium]